MAPCSIDDSEILGDCNSDLIAVKDDELAKLEVHLSQHPVEVKHGMPRAWQGSELDEDQYLIVLTAEEKIEVEFAARDYIASKRQINLLTPTSFSLPKLGPRIRLERQRLSDGLGFIIVRGLKPSEYDSHMNIVLYVGISSYIGNRRAIQFPGGPVLSHVLDLSSDKDREKHRGQWIGTSNQNSALPFHTDNGHILCLYSIHSVPNGGRSRLASAQKVLETLYRERPDLIGVLKDDWEWDTFAKIPTGFNRPLLFEKHHCTILSYQRRPLIGLSDFPRRTGLKPLTNMQIEALDFLEALASRYGLTVELKTGDILYVNNLALLHGREAFKCEYLDGCRRHLLRMFLKDEESEFTLPGPLDAVVRGMYEHDVEEEEFPWSLAPVPYILSP